MAHVTMVDPPLAPVLYEPGCPLTVTATALSLPGDSTAPQIKPILVARRDSGVAEASEPAVSRAQRDAHKRAVRLAKQQAKVYAKARRRERKASGLSPAASPSASPAGSPLVARRAVGSLDSYLNIMSDSLDTGHTSDDTASVIGGTPPPLRRGQLPPPVPTRIAPPRSPLRQLVAQDRAWSSLRHLPGELPPRPLPLAAVAAQLRQLSASQEVLALPPVRGGDDATSATLPSSRAPANASQSRGGSSTRLVSMDNAAATTPPALAFYALWDCPFVPEGQHAKRRAAAVTQMLAAYRRLQAATTKMLGKVDAILVKEYRASAASLEKQAAQSIKAEAKIKRKQKLSEDAMLHFRQRTACELSNALTRRQGELQGKHADVLLTRLCLMHEVQQQHVAELRTLDMDALVESLAAAHDELETQLKATQRNDAKAFDHVLKQRRSDAKQQGVSFGKEQREALRAEHEHRSTQQRVAERVGLDTASQARRDQLAALYTGIKTDLAEFYATQSTALLHYKAGLGVDVVA